MKRRDFLKNTAAVTTAAAIAPNILKGEPIVRTVKNNSITSLDHDRIIVILELFGGNDGLNTIIPGDEAYDIYESLRPNLHIRKVEDKPYAFGGDIEQKFLMHPNLVDGVHNEGFKRLFDEGNLGIVEGVGYDSPNLSHFRSQDIVLTGINSSNPKENLVDGWLARYFLSQLPNYPFEIPEHPLAIQIGGSLSLILKSSAGHMGIALTDPEKFYELGKGLKPEDGLYDPAANHHQSEFNFVNVVAQQSEKYSEAVYNAYQAGKDKIAVQYSGELEEQFAMISALIAGGLETKVYYVRMGNFDHHAQQANEDRVSGQHPTLINRMANAITKFVDDGNQQGWGDRVVGMTISEFGRRPYENGSMGTDHGTANSQFIFGNKANGGFFGTSPDLTLFDDTENIFKQFDFRVIYTDFLQTWFDASQEEVETIFGKYYNPIGVLEQPSAIHDTAINQYNAVSVYPNPSTGTSNIAFELRTAAEVDISVFESSGRMIKRIKKGRMQAGNKLFPFTMEQSGNYICAVTVNGRRYVQKLVVVK
jgi:uncharacterized protein (DUF1501 family)